MTLDPKESRATPKDALRHETRSGRVLRGIKSRLRIVVLVIGLGAISWLAWNLGIEVVLWRAQACIEAREHDRAMAWLHTAQRLRADRAELHFLLARCNRRLEDFEKVQVHLAKAFEKGWEPEQLEREQWLALAQTGQYEKIASRWSELFQQPGSDGPEICKAYVSVALGFMRIGDATRVLEVWETDYPLDPDPYVMRGRLAETMLDWANSAKYFRLALDADPSRMDAKFGLAKALLKQAEFIEAESLLREVVGKDASDLVATVTLAGCLAKIDKREEARNILLATLRTAPNNAEALLELGNIELASQRPEKARGYLTVAARVKPEDREIIYAYARALQATGDAEEARKHFAFVDEATKPLIRLKQLTHQLLADPENTELRYQIATTTWNYKSREEGAIWFQSLLKVDANHAPTHLALARHYQLAGDAERSKKHRVLATTKSGN